ncbi:MAG TPA: hypothetical protein VMI54_25160 [Polyangiaceae bacterium]|nr:hypothetical protein [Polyangiaceae bacterium]
MQLSHHVVRQSRHLSHLLDGPVRDRLVGLEPEAPMTIVSAVTPQVINTTSAEPALLRPTIMLVP